MGPEEISADIFDRLLEAAWRVQRRQPGATRFYCADRAVKEVLGDRLGIVDDLIPPRSMPVYYGLVSRVEAELWRAPAPPDQSHPPPEPAALAPAARAGLDENQERIPEGASE